MKPTFQHLEAYRYNGIPALQSKRGDHFGCFMIRRGSDLLRIIMHDGSAVDDTPAGCQGWEHVSVSVAGPKGVRTPTWAEMCLVKDHFWNRDECVVQFHPAEEHYVNQHPHTLHLWRHVSVTFPTPPIILV